MKLVLQKFKTYLDTFLSPARCAYCVRLLSESAVFCSLCEEHIKPVVSTTITITPSYTLTVFACAAYEQPLVSLIGAKQYSDCVASHQLGRLLVERIPLQTMPAGLLVPVPLHWTRYAQRGYNQAYEIASTISTFTKIPVVSLVGRNRRTALQCTLKAPDRQDNVRNAFYLNKKYAGDYKYKHIVIVDDLMTTGATLQAVAKTLLALRPTSLTAVVAARVIG